MLFEIIIRFKEILLCSVTQSALFCVMSFYAFACMMGYILDDEDEDGISLFEFGIS